ncbi:hypothetical protein A1Q1_04111 [Trichosporon asahii var. asahii CBS 2479]|uniref:tRNA-splicing endonuclease subunit Sen34 n=1 Tax=Trichosporon asahii var. asahii (strain ATCC 90039 / CBS 2479 / JCM 2466 / KCTC 7840 / NBRC 103889/ NCYC 2677 / UAMH 7654) TaxID=1186058 RepID=J5QFR1_TRIAS|nr:hypothetical protein A1Q1_04111 [Trichosporon asahii var. asahii CBS 2479]EJT47118.1 hypothetical protein A1Q1_04111 [Trichosporon asahii var. asahii CBS 2479]
MASAEAGPSSIPLYVINGVATVWDAQSVVQQNAFLGLPLTLMPEETTHLVESGVAHLVAVPDKITPPSAEIVAERTAQRIARSRATAMHVRHEEAKAAAAAKAKYNKVDAAATAKREERARKKALKARDAAIAAGEDAAVAEETYQAALAAIGAPPAAPSAELDVDDSVPTAANSNFFTVVPAAPVVSVEMEKSTSVPAPSFPFPVSLRDTAIASVFRKLHSNGLRMGLGPRFGGEYLVYPGDFLRYHAHFTSQVVKNNEPIRPAELIAWGRLGTGTKKASLICCWNTDEKENAGPEDTEFYSLEWANFG